MIHCNLVHEMGSQDHQLKTEEREQEVVLVGLVDITLKEYQIQKLLPWPAASYSSSSSSSFFLHVFVPVDRYYFAVQRKS